MWDKELRWLQVHQKNNEKYRFTLLTIAHLFFAMETVPIITLLNPRKTHYFDTY